MPSGPGASKVWKIAYASCQKSGFSGFKEGSKGRECARKRAEGIARTRKKR